MAPKTKPLPKMAEKSFENEAGDLLYTGFASKGIEHATYAGKNSDYINKIGAVSIDGTAAGASGMLFADGKLFVRKDVYESYLNDAPGFAILALVAVKVGLAKQVGEIKGYTKAKLAKDIEYLDLAIFKLRSGPMDKSVVAKLTDESEMITLPGNVTIPMSIHERYGRLTYSPGAFYMTEQTFYAASYEFDRALRAGYLKRGRFLVADFNHHSSRERLYLMSTYDEDNPLVAGSIRAAHGIGSDPNRTGYVQSLSNVKDSHQSSQGMYRIVSWEYREEYGGYIFRLEGIDSTSSNAQTRGILMHREDPTKHTEGCVGVKPEEAREMFLPIDGNMNDMGKAEREMYLNAWIGVGVYIYFDPNVQKVYKEQWPVK